MKRYLILIGAVLVLAAPVQATTTTQIRHAEPGCHWFYVGGHKTKSLTVRGHAVIANLDIARQIVSGTATVRIPVGKSVRLGPGKYQIRMAGQMTMDNTLRLVVTKSWNG